MSCQIVSTKLQDRKKREVVYAVKIVKCKLSGMLQISVVLWIWVLLAQISLGQSIITMVIRFRRDQIVDQLPIRGSCGFLAPKSIIYRVFPLIIAYCLSILQELKFHPIKNPSSLRRCGYLIVGVGRWLKQHEGHVYHQIQIR